MCGQCIAISTAWKKNTKLLIWNHDLPPREIVCLRAILKNIDIGRVEKILQRLCQIYYNKGNKAHTLLACKTKRANQCVGPPNFAGRYWGLTLPPRPHRPIVSQLLFRSIQQSIHTAFTCQRKLLWLCISYTQWSDHVGQQQPYSLLFPQLLERRCWEPWNSYL